MMFAAAALLLQTAPAAAPPATQPSGRWTVDYAQNACILTRDYGTAGAPLTLGFNPQPLGGGVQVVLLMPGVASTYRIGKARLILEPTGRTVDSSIQSYGFKQRGQTLATLTSDADVAGDLRTATHVTIERADKTRMRFAVPGMEKAFVALATCQDDLLKGWGVDPGERGRVKTAAASASPADWITSDDYPSQTHVEGVSSILWTIGLDGRVSDCRVTRSSGTAALDQAACGAIARRGRYKPATGFDGKPMVVHQMRNVVWRLPG